MRNMDNGGKTIKIIKGKEYGACEINMQEETNFFHNVYIQAKRCVDEIVDYNWTVCRMAGIWKG